MNTTIANQTVSQPDGTQITVGGTLTVSAIPPVPGLQLLGGKFAFPYPNLTTGAGSPATVASYGTRFDGALQNPSVFATWLATGTDPRHVNPKGVYVKHVNFVTADTGQSNVMTEGRPSYNDLLTNHPTWILRDSSNALVTLYGPTDAVLDWGNDAYIDYLIATTIPQILDSIDNDPNTPAVYFEQDNGSFYARNYVAPLAGSNYAYAYNTDAGVQAAWLHLLGRLTTAFPKLRILISSFSDFNKSVSSQMAVFQTIFSACHGYYSEALTDRHTWWGHVGSGITDAQKRNYLNTTMQLAAWLAASDKYGYFMEGQNDSITMTQADTDYAMAMMNVIRQGNKQYVSKLTITGGNWVPSNFDYQDRALGNPIDLAPVAISPDVWRRRYTCAEAYVNWSSSTVVVTPTPGFTWKNTLGTTFSTISLPSFSGLTVFN
jgi:hypothetical protein